MYNTFLKYLRNPCIPERKSPSLKEFVKLLFLNGLLFIPAALLSYFVANKLGIKSIVFPRGSALFIFYGVFLAPILEEMVFRSWLKWSKRNIYILLIAIILVIALSFFRHRFQHVGIILLLSCIVIFLIYLLRCKNIEQFINKHFKYFYWGSSIAFGLIHASNLTGNIWYLIGFSFILGSPQIVGGFILGYIRMNYGLRYSILFHLIINSNLLFSLLHK
jgi:uncharacterized protein